MNKKPTELLKYTSKPHKLKVVKVFSKISENPSKSLSQAMREVGYSKSYAEKPQELTHTKTWLELTQRYLPEPKMLKEHKRLMFKATKIVTSPTSPDQTVPNDEIRLKAIELGYKLKGKLHEQPQQQTNILILPPELINKYKE